MQGGEEVVRGGGERATATGQGSRGKSTEIFETACTMNERV